VVANNPHEAAARRAYMAHYGDPYKGLMAFSEELCSALRESRPFILPTGMALVLEEDEAIDDGANDSIDADDSDSIDTEDFGFEDVDSIAEGVSQAIDNLEEPEVEDTKSESTLNN
jgi:hypothetical protein